MASAHSPGLVVQHAPAGIVFGTSWLPAEGIGVDLTPHDYIEHELIARGSAGVWTYDAAWKPVLSEMLPYTTRIVVRRPVDPARFTGTVLLEPLHPDLDKAPTWRLAHRWLLDAGHAWVGVTQSAAMAADIAERFPDRYAALDIPAVGAGFGCDIVGQVAAALKNGDLSLSGVERVHISGWSITGSLCRVYLQDGFLYRHRAADGSPSVDGVIIGKSSGGFARPGYPQLSADAPMLPEEHERRTVRGSVPTFEVLSETEGETHRPVLREDSDEPGDRYRLYQVAGTSHRQLQPETVLTNDRQYAATGGELGDARINEEPSDERFELFGGGFFDLLERWVRGGGVPPSAPRFEYLDEPSADGILRRDADGVVMGGLRPPWITVPTAVHRPRSTPAPGALLPLARFAATGSPEQAASMIGHRIPVDPTEFVRRYGSEDGYRNRLRTACHQLVAAGFATRVDADAYLAEAFARRDA